MFEFHDFIGFLGAACVLIAYSLLQFGKISSASFTHSLLNFVGGLMIMFSLLYAWNTTAVFIEVNWIIISLYGLYRCMTLRRKHREETQIS